ncbi:MAG: RNA-binding protein [Planctomycetes bacterium]|nr:RNA-binding protein [Planctomycetota bacterium]
MPKGPRGEKRPADVIGNAIKVARLAVGDEEETVIDDGKDPAAKALGAKGGRARAESLSPAERSKIAKKAAAKRWKKK